MKPFRLRMALIFLAWICVAGCGREPSAPKDMIYIPKGLLEVGVNGEALSPPVEVEPFFIDQFEVTNERFSRCVRQGQCEGRQQALPKPFSKPRQPAVMVDFHQAWALCRFEGKRLATETQWTFAIQSRIGRPHAGSANRIDAEAIVGHRFTFPVGSVDDDRTDRGVYDLGGNVAEIVAEEPGRQSARSGLPRLSSTIIMGAGFLSPPGESIDNPRQVVPDRRFKALWVGFRCAKEIH